MILLLSSGGEAIVRPHRANDAMDERTTLTREVLSAWASLGVILTGALILLVTLTPINIIGGNDFLGIPPTIWHILLFMMLGIPVSLRYATSRAAARSPLRILIMVILAIWLFAGLDELAQQWVTGRNPELSDWFADMGGAALGLALGSLILRFLLARGR